MTCLSSTTAFGLMAFLLLSVSQLAHAGIPKKEILAKMDAKLTSLSKPSAWNAFAEKKFPKVEPDKSAIHVDVEKETVHAKGDTYTLGIGYQQVFIKADIKKVQSVLNKPEFFRELFDLDAPSKVSANIKKGEFQARIRKNVPVVSNQDYTLKYVNSAKGDLWFQRASLVVDKEDFALRDNLKVLEPSKDGVIYREISMVYILRWYIRALGPQMRSIMKGELETSLARLKCAAEHPGDEFTAQIATQCAKKH